LEGLTPIKTASLKDGSILNVLRERSNRVIGRLEIEGIITHMNRGTPSRKAVRSLIASLYGRDEDLVVIKQIKSEYGMGRSRVRANIYDSVERLRLFEPEYLLRRGA